MGKQILIVDDEPDMVDMLKIRLEAAGYSTIAAGDGQEALRLAREGKPDLIILDLMLPKLDGYKVCRLLKFDKKYKHIPIIMFTARAQDSDIKLGKDIGADAYVTKPFDAQVLMGKVRQLLGE